MKIAVCVKPVPDPAASGALTDSFRLIRPEKLVLDDADRYGVELALRLAEGQEGSSVTVYAMSPVGDGNALKSTALAMGADRVVHVVDDALAGADALLTARVLAAAMNRDGFDLVIAGTESSDGYSGVMPMQLAELLDLPGITFATSVEVRDDSIYVVRQTDFGSESVSCPLPALVTITAGIIEPRYPSFKGIMAAKTKPYDQYALADLDEIDVQVRQRIVSAEPAPSREEGRTIVDEGEAHKEILSFLQEVKVL